MMRRKNTKMIHHQQFFEYIRKMYCGSAVGTSINQIILQFVFWGSIMLNRFFFFQLYIMLLFCQKRTCSAALINLFSCLINLVITRGDHSAAQNEWVEWVDLALPSTPHTQPLQTSQELIGKHLMEPRSSANLVKTLLKG